MSKAAATKLDNIAGVLYERSRKSKIKSPRFKAQFLATIPSTKNFGNTTHALMHVYRKTGELKCACCGADNVYFKLYKEKGRVIFKSFVKKGNVEEAMTVDHDLLKSLGGLNNVTNYNPMCYSCNQLRGSRFAEFKEFKDWYDTTKAGIEVGKSELANFCFIDYSLNKNNNQFFGNIAGTNVLPPSVIDAMKKGMRTQTPDAFAHISIKELINLNRNYANLLLNELVFERSFKTQNCRDVPMGEHDFFVGCTSPDHRKVKAHIEAQVKLQLRHRLAMQSSITLAKRQAAVEQERTEELVSIQEVNSKFTFKNLWIKFTNIFA